MPYYYYHWKVNSLRLIQCASYGVCMSKKVRARVYVTLYHINSNLHRTDTFRFGLISYYLTATTVNN
jgi:hypothetical protein